MAGIFKELMEFIITDKSIAVQIYRNKKRTIRPSTYNTTRTRATVT